MEAVECGAASLAMILGYYGRWVSLETLRVQCDVSRDGSNALNVIKVGRSYGLESQGMKRSPEELTQVTLPCVVFWNLSHFLVVEGFGSRGVWVNDPAHGPRTISYEEFDGAFSGIVLTFKPTADFKKGGRKDSFWGALAQRLRGSEWALLFVFLTSFLLIFPGLIVPSFQSTFVDEILGKDQRGWILWFLAAMALTAAFNALLSWVQTYYLLRFQTKLALTSSARFFWHVLRLPPEFYAQRFAGEISSRVALNDSVASLLSGRLAKAALNCLMIVFYGVVMWLYEPNLTVLVVILAALNFLTLSTVSRLRTDMNMRLLQDNGKLQGTTIAGLQIIETIKATGRENDFFSRWAGFQARLMNTSQNLGLASQALSTVPSLLMALGNVLVLCLGGLDVMNGLLTIGMLIAFQSLMGSFMGPVNSMVELGSTIQEAHGDMSRLDDVLNNEPQSVGPAMTGHEGRLTGKLELRDVTFGYGRLAPPLINNFSLVIEPGQRVAVVGATGSGKSTVARLVTGLYQPWSGQVMLDDRPRGDIPAPVINSSVAHVDQDIMLFSGTLRENLTLWDPTISDQQVLRACEDAFILEAITSRPAGLDSHVEEGGSNYSGGERQRLEIARALVGRPSILVLDEATSALDPLVEKSIDERLRARGCSCLIVAHRLSTIRDADHIIVLQKGTVVQRGTHEELIAQEGAYKHLIQAEPGG